MTRPDPMTAEHDASVAHTEGRLEVGAGFGCFALRSGKDELIAHVFIKSEREGKANARRLVACWNACCELETELLERVPLMIDAGITSIDAVRKERDELIEALRAASHALRSYQYGNSATDLAKDSADHADALLAKHSKAPV